MAAFSCAGSPSTSAGFVSMMEYAFVASSTWSRKSFLSFASSATISLKRFCRSPSSATPESSASCAIFSRMRLRTGVSAGVFFASS